MRQTATIEIEIPKANDWTITAVVNAFKLENT